MVDFQKPMRRGDKKINDISLIHSILKKAIVMRLGLCYDNTPYIVPLNFVFDENQGNNGVIYLHSALEGLKIDIIGKNRNICFEVEDALEIVSSPNPCNWGMKYISVIGHGETSFENDLDEKKQALDLFMNKYSSITQNTGDKLQNGFDYNGDSLALTCLLKIKIKSLVAKKSGY
jgi:uncharacterized protein